MANSDGKKNTQDLSFSDDQLRRRARREYTDNPNACAPGSIEQQLDMCESGNLRGDEILHLHGHLNQPTEDNEMLNNYRVDMSEEDREGDEESGDDHSAGLQGGETELKNQSHIDSGLPGGTSEPKKRSAA